MPLYEYQCDACAHRFEVIQKYADPPIQTCPKCGETVHKLQSAPAFQFKGKGWYVTDYAKSGQETKEGGKSGLKTDVKSESKSDDKSESKSDGKTGAKSEGSGSSGDKSDSTGKGESSSKSTTPSTPAPSTSTSPKSND